MFYFFRLVTEVSGGHLKFSGESNTKKQIFSLLVIKSFLVGRILTCNHHSGQEQKFHSHKGVRTLLDLNLDEIKLEEKQFTWLSFSKAQIKNFKKLCNAFSRVRF